MTITYKLVGLNSYESDVTEMVHKNWDYSNSIFNYNDAIKYFQDLGLPDKLDDDMIKFITNAEVMKSDKDYNISEDDNFLIYVFSQNSDIKEIVKEIFINEGLSEQQGEATIVEPVDETLTQPLVDNSTKITKEIIDMSNKTTVELFQNNNFKTLLRIFYEDPTLYKTFSSYVTSGDMVCDAFFITDEDNDFTNQLEEIKNLNIGLDDEKIIKALKKFNGHINLSLRYLLTSESTSESKSESTSKGASE